MKKIILFFALFVSLMAAAQGDPCSKVTSSAGEPGGMPSYSISSGGVIINKFKVGNGGAEYTVNLRLAFGTQQPTPLPASLTLANGAKIERASVTPNIFFLEATNSFIHNYFITLTFEEIKLLMDNKITIKRVGTTDKDMAPHAEDLLQGLNCMIEKKFP